MSMYIQKNCIIVGPLDSYCLSCEYCLKTRDSILDHIQTTPHQEKLQSTPYLEQYKDDGIRQFKRGYYCEFCSVLVKTKKKMALHVIEGSHKNSRVEGTLREVENGVLALNTIFIECKAWHGVMDSTCLICNLDITDENDHIKDQSHIFVLIKSKLDCIDDSIFRKVDGDFINCLICNIIINNSTFTMHLKNECHLTQLTKCKKAYNTFVNNTAIKTPNNGNKYNTNNVCKEMKAKEHKKVVNNLSTEKNDSKTTVKKNINQEQTGDMNKDKKDENSGENVEVSNDLKTTNNESIKAGNSVFKTSVDSGSNSMDNSKIFEPREAIQEAQTFSKKHKIKYSFGKHSAYCKACNVTISSSLQRMRDHVSQIEHKENFSKKFVLGREPFSKFLNTYSKHLVLKSNEVVVVLNENICISYASFLMITSNHYGERCQLCETSDNLYPYELHERNHRHKTLNCNTTVMCSFTSEFIRNIRDSLYHCGFCNFLMTWTDLKDHLKSISHRKKKDAYSFLLRFKTS